MFGNGLFVVVFSVVRRLRGIWDLYNGRHSAIETMGVESMRAHEAKGGI